MSTTTIDAHTTPSESTHGHDDSDHHDHDHHSMTEQNKSHFNKIARDIDDFPQALALAKMVATAVLEENWQNMRDEHDGDEVDPETDRPLGGTRMLEFACGSGLVSREIAPFVAKVVGVDISQGMVDIFNEKARAKGFDVEDMHAVCVNLLGEDESVAPEVQTATVLKQIGGEKFDLILCSAAYHHLPDPGRITKALSALLAPKGSLLITDIYKSSDDFDLVKTKGIFHEDKHLPESMRGMDFSKTVAHRGGFAEADMKGFFEGDGGLTDFAFRLVGKMDFFAPPAKEGEASDSSKHDAGGAGSEDQKAEGHGHGHGPGPLEWFIAKGTKAD